jgi:nucleolar protein 15
MDRRTKNKAGKVDSAKGGKSIPRELTEPMEESQPAYSRGKGPLAPPSDDEEDEIRLDGDDDEEEDSSEDESDVDGDGPDIPGVDISTLPTIAKDDATVARKLSAAKAKAKDRKGQVCAAMPSFAWLIIALRMTEE